MRDAVDPSSSTVVPAMCGPTTIHTKRILSNYVYAQMTQLSLTNFHCYLHITYSRFVCPRPHWIWCLIITWIPIFYYKVSLYARFPGSRFSSLAWLSRTQSHDISRLFIPTSKLRIGILTFTNMGMYWISWSGFHIFYMRDSIEKISKEIPWAGSPQNFPLFMYTDYIELKIIDHHYVPNRFIR